MAQQAAYVSTKTAMKILRKGQPERLYSVLTEEQNGSRVRKVVNEKKFVKMKATTRKAWSLRSLRWMEQLPEGLRMKDARLKTTQTELKQWIKHHVPVRGDRILWGKPLTGEMKRRIRVNEVSEDGNGGPEPQQPEAQQPGTQLDQDKAEGQEGSRYDLVGVRGYQGLTGHQVPRMVCWWVLLIILEGQNVTIERRVSVKWKRITIEEIKLPVDSKEGFLEKLASGKGGCGGHRGSVERVKTGEG